MSSKAKGGGEKGSKADGVGGGLVCAHCKKVGELGAMKRCGRCHRACYCSVECQRIHWGKGGHKKVCRNEGSRSDCSDGVPGASGGVGASLKHPCPICLDNEDDAGDMGACLSCGQLFCGSCRTSLRQRGVTNCPTCRAVIDVPAEEYVRRLRQLLARPNGRHTSIAQRSLALCYSSGRGVLQDDTEAARWHRLAADRGFADAQVNIGICYADGIGVAQNVAEAVRWYRLAADQRDKYGQCRIGVCYQNGTGVAQDDAEAVRWYRLAADQGNVDAQFRLGVCYAIGTGVAQDDAEALRWYRLAADQGDADAQGSVGLCYLDGSGVAQDAAEAVRWYRLAADQGDAEAQRELARRGM
jgi:TPR repeat protein